MASTDKTQRIPHCECTKNQKREYISIWKIQTRTCGPLKKFTFLIFGKKIAPIIFHLYLKVFWLFQKQQPEVFHRKEYS